MKAITIAILACAAILSGPVHAQGLKGWDLAKQTTLRIAKGEKPSKICDAARSGYFLLLVDDAEPLVVYQRPEGTCVIGFPSENHREAFHVVGQMVMTQPMEPASNRRIIWIKATLDKAGTTDDFYKLVFERSEGGVTDAVFLSRKGNGPLVQWILS